MTAAFAREKVEPMSRQRHPATPEDESRRFQFPHGTDEQLHHVIAMGSTTRGLLERGGWKPTRCAFPSDTDRRTIEVVLDGPGSRKLRVRFHAKNYLASSTTAGDAPSERYPDVVARLSSDLVDVAERHAAGDEEWIDH